MNKKKSKKVLKIIAAVLGILIALYCVYHLTAIIVFGDNMPMALGVGAAVVLTGSMEPTLSANDLIFVARSSGYKVDDIVVYSTQGTPVVHRVIAIDEESGVLTTKGDANNTADEPVSISRVKGKLLFSVPGVGVIPRFVRTVPGMIMTLVILFVLLFLSVQSKKKTAEEQSSEERIDAMLEEIKQLRAKAEANGGSEGDAPSEKEENPDAETK